MGYGSMGVVTYRCPDEAGMALDPRLVRIAEEADGAQGGGCDELDGEDTVDLADELVADVDGGFGDGASKLFVESDVSKGALFLLQKAEDVLRDAGFLKMYGENWCLLTLKSSGMLSSLLRGSANRPGSWCDEEAAVP